MGRGGRIPFRGPDSRAGSSRTCWPACAGRTYWAYAGPRKVSIVSIQPSSNRFKGLRKISEERFNARSSPPSLIQLEHPCTVLHRLETKSTPGTAWHSLTRIVQCEPASAHHGTQRLALASPTGPFSPLLRFDGDRPSRCIARVSMAVVPRLAPSRGKTPGILPH